MPKCRLIGLESKAGRSAKSFPTQFLLRILSQMQPEPESDPSSLLKLSKLVLGTRRCSARTGCNARLDRILSTLLVVWSTRSPGCHSSQAFCFPIGHLTLCALPCNFQGGAHQNKLMCTSEQILVYTHACFSMFSKQFHSCLNIITHSVFILPMAKVNRFP